jgi:hypothetical protein
VIALVEETVNEAKEKTARTRIRARTFLIALGVAALTLTAGTYINARYMPYSVSIDMSHANVIPEQPPAQSFEKQYREGRNLGGI